MEKPWIWLNAANDINDPNRFLSGIVKEINRINEILDDHERYQVTYNYFTDLANFQRSYLSKADRLSVFHFAGHGNERGLELAAHEGRRKEKLAFAKGLAGILKNVDRLNLRLVFLNACATESQIKFFHQAGIPIVIGTTRPVKDEVATLFSISFYQALEKKQSVANAFRQAEAFLLSKYHDPAEYYRDRMSLSVKDENELAHPYVIQYANGDEAYGNERLTDWVNEKIGEEEKEAEEEPLAFAGGEKTYLDCNREDQKDSFRELVYDLIEGRTHQPQMLVIHGGIDQGLTEFSDCLQLFTLKEELSRIGRDRVKDLKIDWPTKKLMNKKKGTVAWKSLVMNLKKAVKDASHYNEKDNGSAILNRIGRTRDVIWIRHELDVEENWHAQSGNFIRKYMNTYWNRQLTESDPFVFIILILKYPKVKGWKKWMPVKDPVMPIIQNIAQDLQHVHVLERLESIDEKMVRHWQKKYYDRPKYSNLAKEIFQKAQVTLLPMHDILIALDSFCQDYSKQYATLPSSSPTLRK